MAKAVKKTAAKKGNPFAKGAKGAKGKDDKNGGKKKGFVPFGKKKGKK